jgi:hypothetical protein
MGKGLEVLCEHVTTCELNSPLLVPVAGVKTFHTEKQKSAKMCHFFNNTHLSCEHLV